MPGPLGRPLFSRKTRNLKRGPVAPRPCPFRPRIEVMEVRLTPTATSFPWAGGALPLPSTGNVASNWGATGILSDAAAMPLPSGNGGSGGSSRLVPGGGNSPTITSPGDLSNDEGDPVSLALQASDPAGNPLAYSAT